jgi:hypothetical protein
VALAYTDANIRYETLAVDPPEDFIDALDAILLDVGWEHVSVYENGWLYQLESPQELLVRCRIWNPAVDATYTRPHFALQFLSASDPLTTGHIHRFFAGWEPDFEGDTREFTEYKVWANRCSIFIGAVHPDPRDNQPRAVQGGIPYAYSATSPTPECAAENPAPEETNELWWSAGDDTGTYDETAPFPSCAMNFRNNYWCQRYSLCHNGTIVNRVLGTPTLANETSALQLGILRAAYYWNPLIEHWPDGFVRRDMTPLATEPFLIDNGIVFAGLYNTGIIFGELYDAVLVSRPMELDAPETIWETVAGRVTEWVNYSQASVAILSSARDTAEDKCASLLLLLDAHPSGPGEQMLNVAY